MASFCKTLAEYYSQDSRFNLITSNNLALIKSPFWIDFYLDFFHVARMIEIVVLHLFPKLLTILKMYKPLIKKLCYLHPTTPPNSITVYEMKAFKKSVQTPH